MSHKALWKVRRTVSSVLGETVIGLPPEELHSCSILGEEWDSVSGESFYWKGGNI